MNFSDEDFLENLKKRDHDTISILIEKYHEILIRGALKQGLGFDQAEEVVQSTWSTFFEKIENFKARSHIRTYLFGIMLNKVKELWRSNRKYTQDFQEQQLEVIFDQEGNFLNHPQDPGHWLENAQLLEMISEELKKLPENQKLAFILKEVEGESTKDICNIMNINSTHLGVLLFRAKNGLRMALEKRLEKQNK